MHQAVSARAFLGHPENFHIGQITGVGESLRNPMGGLLRALVII